MPATADGWRPYAQAGRVVQVRHPNPLRAGVGMEPRAAGEMLDRAVQTLTGAPSAAEAWRKIIRPTDVVALKPNGLGGRFLATHKELLDATIESLLGIGVPPANIIVYEQFVPYMRACRVDSANVPQGVRVTVHRNRDAGSEWTSVLSGRTRYVRPLLDATAVIAFPLAKDHAISGVTGCLKNMTHGSITNPADFHRHAASPQIAELYAHEAIRSRVRLHVMDATRVLWHGGPQDAPDTRRTGDAIWVSTDPVAIDALLVQLVEMERRAHRLPTLVARGTPPSHVTAAAALGLGIADLASLDVVQTRS
jgi:uncharacterized protein (DUF362 family)